MRIDPRLLALAALLLALLGWGGYWFFENHRWEALESQVRESAEARRNPWLAAQRFLTGLGLEAESLSGRQRLLQPPEAPGVLVVKRLDRPLPAPAQQRLLAWIRAGGHLILRPDADADGAMDFLLQPFGIRLQTLDWGDSEDAVEAAGCDCLASFHYPGYAQPLQAAFAADLYLSSEGPEPDWVIANASGPQLLQLGLGQGRLTLVTDQGWLANDAIGEQDHALLLALLVGEADSVWLLYGGAQPGLWSLLWRHAPQLLGSLLLLLALLLWRWSRRNGPLLAAPAPARRNLIEHLQAAAQYAWRSDRAQGLLGASRQALEQTWLHRHPQLERLSQAERSAWIADSTGLAPAAVERALYQPIASEAELIRASALLQKLMNQGQGRARSSE